jgi:hypothetical protein
VMSIAKKQDQSPTPEAQENWITHWQLSQSVAKHTGLFMTNHTVDKGLTLVQAKTEDLSRRGVFFLMKEWT